MAPLSENRDFSGTKPPLDLRPVCKFKSVRCGPVEHKPSFCSGSCDEIHARRKLQNKTSLKYVTFLDHPTLPPKKQALLLLG